ncbi:uncharacterized protein AAG666_013010 [Megaptera novaeangliae]
MEIGIDCDALTLNMERTAAAFQKPQARRKRDMASTQWKLISQFCRGTDPCVGLGGTEPWAIPLLLCPVKALEKQQEQRELGEINLPLAPGSGGETDANFCCTYFGPRLPPPRLSSLSHRQLLRGGDLELARSHSLYQRRRERRRAGGGGGLSRASAPGAGVPGPRSGRRAGRRAERRPPPGARGGCARRRAHDSSAGSFLSELQFQCLPGLQHPLRPPPETTFNSPGGSRGSPAGWQRNSGCRGKGGAQEWRPPQCASSLRGEERAALSSRSPRDCSPDVTPPPPRARRRSGAEGGVRGARTRECERVCVPAHVCLASPGPVGTAAGSCDEPETELPANRSRRAAVSSRGRSLPGIKARKILAKRMDVEGQVPIRLHSCLQRACNLMKKLRHRELTTCPMDTAGRRTPQLLKVPLAENPHLPGPFRNCLSLGATSPKVTPPQGRPIQSQHRGVDPTGTSGEGLHRLYKHIFETRLTKFQACTFLWAQ